MKIVQHGFAVPEGHSVDLKHWPTKVPRDYMTTSTYEGLLAKHVSDLARLQRLLYASRSYAVLLIVQGMDAAGKDGSIQHVMSGVNPQGCQVFSFKHPSAAELEHDFLWRTSKDLPPRGQIGIFNRSYYEEVLIARVHPDVIQSEGIPDTRSDLGSFWSDRYRSIRDFERHLHANGTRVVKIYLHLSKREQRKRFVSRIDDPDKNWKLSLDDVKERGFWIEYMDAYACCLSATTSVNSPWFIVPADDKESARLFVSEVLVAALEKLNLSYPRSDRTRLNELASIREQLGK